ncbi:f-box domain-containing protein [Gigaspora margarita]|uniref:F-box domain-containing protein n=1 Tax=Gigaspora margarita TaxID=4874 RepID=A0A8H3XIM7_GIGMA|nr:f-box domain-containing protein [Gigaspora margarita]
MIPLPNECLFEIFNNFRTDYKFLFSCLLVNRHWCRIIIPILWSEPTDSIENSKLIRTCLLILNSEEQAQLIPFKIILPTCPKPLFEYTNYTTSCGYSLNDGIINWLNENYLYKGVYDEDDYNYDELVSAVKCSLISMFLRTSRGLKCLCVKGIIYNREIKNLYKNTTITTLKFYFNRVDYEGIKALADTISKNTSLTSLSIYQLGSKDLKMLAEAFRKNVSLISLTLCGINIVNLALKQTKH